MQFTKNMEYKKGEKKMRFLPKLFSLITFLSLIIFHTILPMEQSSPKKVGWLTFAGSTLLDGFSGFRNFLTYTSVVHPTDPFPFMQLPEETQTIIIQLLASYCITKTLKESTYIINALAQTNKRLNKLINNPTFSFKIIKHLGQQFGCSDETAAIMLQTQAAKQCLLLQDKLKELCQEMIVEEENNNVFKRLQKLDQDGINFTFTYHWDKDNEGLSPLMYAAKYGNRFLVSYLLKKDINANQANFTGNTALSYADVSVMPLLIARPDLNINQQDAAGNTALFKEIKNYFAEDEDNDPALLKIKMLLKAGADTMIVNKKGHTSLDAAKETGDQKLIDLVQEYSHEAQ